MTKDLNEISYDGETSSSSCGSFDITAGTPTLQSIAIEEERLMLENMKTAIEEESAYNPITPEDSEDSLQSYEDAARQTEVEIKKQKYKRLMHLLRNSQMYAVILKNKLKEDEAKAKKRLRKPKSDLNEVLNEEDINDGSARSEQENLECLTLEEDFFKETRTTRLGFTVSTKQPILLEGGTLKDYQLKGLYWMINLFHNGVNGILADEMGLGKTIQVISFICHLIEKDIKGPFLIVAPLSTITNWMAEFKKFAPKVPVLLYHGSGDYRRQLRQRLLQTTKVGKKKVHYVIVTSYEVPMHDKHFMGSIHWYYLIIDEGHRIKNHQAQLSRTLRGFKTIGRLLLTGTPLQNNLSELWSLLNFLLPEVFSSLDVFESWFDIKSLEKNGAEFMQEKINLDIVSVLQEILVPFVLRREKKDVNLDLPTKKEILIYCSMTQTQKKLYEATIDRTIEFLLKREKEVVVNINEPLPKRRCFILSPYGRNKNEKEFPISYPETPKKEEERYDNHVVMANPQMQLRRIVNHPYLVQFPLEEGTEFYKIDESMVHASGKLQVFDTMLTKLKAKGHRVLVLSYFKVLLDILEDLANLRDYKYCRFDGSTDLDMRTEEIARFSSDPEIFIFFTTIRAGGLGINLTSADTVILYDSDWNPQINIQAQSRCHRIGQTKPVVVYRLCSLGTIDERIIERGNAKRRLEKMILQKRKFTSACGGPNLSLTDLQELKKLLESTDHDLAINSNTCVFSDEEWDALLDRTDMTSKTKEMDSRGFKLLSYEN